MEYCCKIKLELDNQNIMTKATDAFIKSVVEKRFTAWSNNPAILVFCIQQIATDCMIFVCFCINHNSVNCPATWMEQKVKGDY